MKMHELLHEGEQLDELNLAGIMKGAKKAGGAIAGGAAAAGKGLAAAGRAAAPVVGKAASLARRGAAAVGRAAPGVIQGVGNVANAAVNTVGSVAGNTAGAIGNVASQAVGGVAQTVGAAGGGLMHGFNVARHGGKFGASGDMAGHERGNWAPGPANAQQPQQSQQAEPADAETTDRKINSWSVIDDYKKLTPTQQKSVLSAITPKPQQQTQTPESTDFDNVVRLTKAITK